MRIAIGGDHGGYRLTQVVCEDLHRMAHHVSHCGAWHYDPNDDYPDFAAAVGKAVLRGEAERGVIICGSGVGASIAANKLRGIRAALCHDPYSARQGVEDDDMNVICLGGWVVGDALALEIVRAFLGAQFSGHERHQRRLAKIRRLEQAH